jgi:putative membrane protein
MELNIGLALVADTFAVTAATAAPPRTFLRDAIQGDLGEVRIGALAQQRARSPAARDFAAMLVRDHGGHKDKAVALARIYHMPIPNGPSPEARSNIARLQAALPRNFDRLFARMMVSDHRKDIAKYQAQVRTGDRRTRDFANETLPTLREHLRTAQSLPS